MATVAAAAAGNVQSVGVEELATLLQHTFSTEAGTRQAAEARIVEAERAPGTVATLLQIVTIPQLHVQVRQAAALRLKHSVRDCWKGRIRGHLSTYRVPVHPSDRQTVRQNILEAIMVQTDETLRVQLLVCLYNIIKQDFPEAWPGLFESIMHNLKSGEDHRVLGGLLALKAIYKRYEFFLPPKRILMNDIIAITIPLFTEMMQVFIRLSEASVTDHQQGHALAATGLLALNPTVASAHAGMRVITRMYYMAQQIEIYDVVKEPSMFSSWMQLLMRLIRIKITVADTEDAATGQSYGQLSARDRVIASPLCKAKKWAARIMFSLFERWGQARGCRTKEARAFLRFFHQQYARPLTEFFMSLLRDWSRGTIFISPRVLNYAVKFIETSVNYTETYGHVLRPNARFLVEGVILPLVCMTPREVSMRVADPRQFVLSTLSLNAGFVAPDHAACNCLIHLVRMRTDDTLGMTLDIVANILNEYAQHVDQLASSASSGDVNARQALLQLQIKKDGALRTVGSLAHVLVKEPSLLPSLEMMLTTHVLPEFQNPLGMLRARALWCVSKFSALQPWQNVNALGAIMKSCVSALNDADVAVQIEAAFCVPVLLSDHGDNFLPFLRENMAGVLQRFFALYDEIGACDIIVAVGDLVGRLGQDIAPFAFDIVKRLSDEFLKLLQDENANVNSFNDDDEDSGLTMVESLRAISALISTTRRLPGFVPTLYPHVGPVLQALLTPEGLEHLEDTLEMIALLATPYCYDEDEDDSEDQSAAPMEKRQKLMAERKEADAARAVIYSRNPGGTPIDEFTWSFFPLIVKAHNEFAADYIGNMLPAFDSYVAHGTKAFCSNPEYPRLLCSVVISAYAGGKDREVEAAYATKLFHCMLAHCRGHIDEFVPDIIRAVVEKLKVAEKGALRLVLCDVLGVACWYNPALFFHVCVRQGEEFTKFLFNVWLTIVSDESNASRNHHRMAVIGLSSLCFAPLTSAPQSLQAAFPQVLSQALRAVRQCCMDEMVEMKKREAGESDDLTLEEVRSRLDDAEHGKIVNVPANRDCVDLPEGKDDCGDADDESDSDAKIEAMMGDIAAAMYGTELDVDENYASPLDSVGEFSLFCDAIDAMRRSQSASGVCEQWLHSLTAEQREALEGVQRMSMHKKNEGASGAVVPGMVR